MPKEETPDLTETEWAEIHQRCIDAEHNPDPTQMSLLEIGTPSAPDADAIAASKLGAILGRGD